MAEGGLSASDAAVELRRHNAHSGHGEPRVGNLVPIVEALLLSVVTIVTAWAGYSAAKWSTDSRLDLAHASTLRLEANRALASAAETRDFDSSTFDAWYTAYVLGNQEKMDIAERRFRPSFRVAFDAWLATSPATNPNAPPGPTYMAQYQQPEQARAARLDAQANRSAARGERAGSVADNYVRITVLLAAVLFLIGIGTTFRLRAVRYGLASVGGLILVAAVVLISHQPRPH